MNHVLVAVSDCWSILEGNAQDVPVKACAPRNGLANNVRQLRHDDYGGIRAIPRSYL